MLNVLILCTGNSCRSILGEALLNHLGKGCVKAFSAGSDPTGEINPNALVTLKKHGIPTEGLYSKRLDSFSGQHIDIVITVCDRAGAEECPVYLNKALRVHWGLPDPALVSGTEREIKAAFQSTYDALERRINKMLVLPLDELSDHELINEFNEIGEIDISENE
ncbi:MAG: arsenate reductase ArsC [Planctomycetes bacterium]|nr:arsenate reductase ArsC [Planctomycetota bacterium]